MMHIKSSNYSLTHLKVQPVKKHKQGCEEAQKVATKESIDVWLDMKLEMHLN